LLDRHAESEGPHLGQVPDLPAQLLDHEANARIVTGVHAAQVREDVPATSPFDAAKVHVVVDPEVVERHEQALVHRVPEPHLVGGPPVEEVPDIDPVGAFGSGREAQQLARLDSLQQRTVGRRLRVVELIDDDDLKAAQVEAVHRCAVQ
jgi:hypothetical protein